MNHNRIYKPNQTTYEQASGLLAAGELVSFPTETVYGIGADASNGEAVAKIYAAKNRPDFNPLIVHVSDRDSASNYALMNDLAKRLADAFWPGPFTMVLPRKKKCGISSLVTAGLETIAIRVPKNDVAHALISTFNGPVAAPSANKSGKISPTTAHHVEEEFGGELQMIIDGGPCEKGIESTIVAITDNHVTLLRPGSITADDIKKIVGKKINISEIIPPQINAPGQMASHYAPNTKMRLNVSNPQPGECLLAFGDIDNTTDTFNLNLSRSGNLNEAAANLFSMMRKLDAMGFSTIAVSPIPETGLGVAINDRLRRAAAPKE